MFDDQPLLRRPTFEVIRDAGKEGWTCKQALQTGALPLASWIFESTTWMDRTRKMGAYPDLQS